MQLSVLRSDWGDAQLCDIEVLLKDTASHLNQLLRDPFDQTIRVIRAPCSDRTPRICYRSSPDEPFVIHLDTRDRLWCQFAYQFSHEFCHVLSGYEHLRDNPNNWFHETICELASVFTLQRMAERWPTHPPYPNWADYAESLRSYGQERFHEADQLPEEMSLEKWLSIHEEELRKCSNESGYKRSKNALVAYALLPIFESDPMGWNSITKFPNSRAGLAVYLSDWYSSVDSVDKSFVARLSDALGHTLAT